MPTWLKKHAKVFYAIILGVSILILTILSAEEKRVFLWFRQQPAQSDCSHSDLTALVPEASANSDVNRYISDLFFLCTIGERPRETHDAVNDLSRVHVQLTTFERLLEYRRMCRSETARQLAADPFIRMAIPTDAQLKIDAYADCLNRREAIFHEKRFREPRFIALFVDFALDIFVIFCIARAFAAIFPDRLPLNSQNR